MQPSAKLRCSRCLSLVGDGLAQRWGDLAAKDLDGARIVSDQDKGADTVIDHKWKQFLDPLPGRPLEKAMTRRAEFAVIIEDTAYLARVASSFRSGLINDLVAKR